MVENLLRIMLKEESKKKDKKEEKPSDQVVSTKHTITIDGKAIPFTATAGYMQIKDGEDKVKGKIYYTAYIKDGVSEKAKRPITFTFNGGPGCASLWLHFGCMGPKRVQLTETGDSPPPPYVLEDNPQTWLEFTDMVFIDPVGTGFSRAGKDEDPRQFYGLEEDLESVAEFIRLYATQNKRWLSPKFLAGESYGTLRAAGLSGTLQTKVGMDLNGIVLVSSILNTLTTSQETGNDLPFILFIPTYTASAWYHEKLSPRLQEDLHKTLKEVEEWVMTDLLTAMARGDNLPEKEFDEIAEKLASYTGLSKKFVKNCRLRIPIMRFVKELLRDENRTVGRMDGRFKGIDSDNAGEHFEYDPSFTWGPFMAAVGEYIRGTLKYKNDLPYSFISNEAFMAWNWKGKEMRSIGYPNVADILRHEICRNRYLNVFVVAGYYDLATPYFAMDYTVSHMGLDPSLRGNVTTKYYDSGHMVYYNRPSHIQMTKDIKEFYGRCTNLKPVEE